MYIKDVFNSNKEEVLLNISLHFNLTIKNDILTPEIKINLTEGNKKHYTNFNRDILLNKRNLSVLKDNEQDIIVNKVDSAFYSYKRLINILYYKIPIYKRFLFKKEIDNLIYITDESGFVCLSNVAKKALPKKEYVEFRKSILKIEEGIKLYNKFYSILSDITSSKLDNVLSDLINDNTQIFVDIQDSRFVVNEKFFDIKLVGLSSYLNQKNFYLLTNVGSEFALKKETLKVNSAQVIYIKSNEIKYFHTNFQNYAPFIEESVIIVDYTFENDDINCQVAFYVENENNELKVVDYKVKVNVSFKKVFLNVEDMSLFLNDFSNEIKSLIE